MKILGSFQRVKLILGIADNRLAAVSLIDARAGSYTRLDKLGLNTGEAKKVYLKAIPFPVVVTRKVFKDGDAMPVSYTHLRAHET